MSQLVTTYKGRKSDLRKFLVASDPHCHWCERKVIIYPNEEWCQDLDDLATIDHLVSRFYRNKGDIVPKVLACNKCNKHRAKQEEKELEKIGLLKKGQHIQRG